MFSRWRATVCMLLVTYTVCDSYTNAQRARLRPGPVPLIHMEDEIYEHGVLLISIYRGATWFMFTRGSTCIRKDNYYHIFGRVLLINPVSWTNSGPKGPLRVMKCRYSFNERYHVDEFVLIRALKHEPVV